MSSPTATCPRCGSTQLSLQPSGTICLSCLSRRLLPPGASPAGASSAETSAATGALPEQLGPYFIVEELGRGGMGIVYAARHLELDRLVALKVIRRGEWATADDEARFIREAQSAAKLRHPGIVTLFETGRDGPHAWFAMELLAGGDLARRLRERPPGPRECATLLSQLALALAHAHAASLVHRDLKPANILLDEAGAPHIADFGLAIEAAPGATLTQAGATLGTPLYLAPEVVAGRAHSPASDLYALGAIFYLGLTGRPPHLGDHAAAVLASIARGDPPPPRLLVPALSPDLEAVCLRALERDPANRYPSADAFAADLQRWLDGEPTHARPLGVFSRGTKWARRRPALAALWSLTALAAAGGVTAAVLINEQRRDAESARGAAETARAAAETERDRAERAEAKLREQLRAARLAEAESHRSSRRLGARAAGFAALREAVAIRPGPDLQDAAVKLLIRPEVGEPVATPVKHEGAPPLSMNTDNTGRYLAKHEDDYAFSVRTRDGDREVLRAGGPTEKWGRRMSVSADGRWVVTRFADQSVRGYRVDGPTPPAAPVWRLEQRPRTEPPEYPTVSGDIAVDPAAPRVVVGHREGGFTVHDLETGRETGAWRSAGSSVLTLFSPDGKSLATATFEGPAEGRRWRLVVLDSATLTPRHEFAVDDAVLDLAWSQDSGVVVLGTGAREVRWLDAHAGRWLGRLARRDRDPMSVGWAPVGWESALFVGTPGKAWSWIAAASGEEIVGGSHGGNDAVFFGDGKTFELSNAVDARLTFTLEAPRAFRVRTIPEEYRATEPSGGRRSLGFTRDGRFVVAAMTGWVGAIDLTTGRTVAEVAGVEPSEGTTVWLDETAGQVLVSGEKTGLRRIAWKREGTGDNARAGFGTAVTLDTEKEFSLRDVAPANGRLVLANWRNGGLRVLEPTPDGGVRELRRWPKMPAYDASFSPDGTQLLINFWGSPDTTKEWPPGIWDLATGEPVRRLAAASSAEALWSHDGRVLVTSNGLARTILWDAATGQELPSPLPKTAQGEATSFALSPDGRWFACSTSPVSGVADPCVHLVDLQGKEPDLRLFAPGGVAVTALVEFSPDGNRVYAIDTAGRFYEWNVPEIRAGIAEFRVRP